MFKIKNKKILLKLIGVVLFFLIIFTQIDFQKFYSLFFSLNPWLLILASLLSLPPVIIKMFRWQYILKRLKISYPLKKTFKIYQLSILFGMFTPLNSGDFAGRIAFLKNNGYKIKVSLLGILIDRVADLVIILIIAFWGILFILKFFKIEFLIIIGLILLLLVLGLLSLRENFLRRFITRIFFVIVPKKFQEKLKTIIKEIIVALNYFSFKDVLSILGITIIAQIANLFFLYSLILILGINQIKILYLLFINAILSLLALIPITIGGFGTREATLIAFFSSSGVQNEKTLIFSLLIFFLSLTPLVLIGFYCLIKK